MLREVNRSKKLSDEIASTKEENEKLRRYLLNDEKEEVKETPIEVQAKTIQELKKKIQKADKELQEQSVKNESQQQQLDKAINLLRRELGDFANLDVVRITL